MDFFLGMPPLICVGNNTRALCAVVCGSRTTWASSEPCLSMAVPLALSLGKPIKMTVVHWN